jgi:N4-gp56 family major capsid protein
VIIMSAVGSGINGFTDGNQNITSGTLAPAMATYYEKVFLARAEYALVLKEGGQVRTHPANEGRTVNFTRLNPIGVVTSPLGQLSNPVTCPINLSTVSMTLSEYGLTTYTSRFASLTSIDANMKEQIAAVGQNMGETLNALVGNELQNGTSYYGNGHTSDTIAAGDTLDACDIRRITRTLELNKALRYSDGKFLGKTDPYSKLNLIADTTWVNAKTYSDVNDLYKGEMGELYGVRWLLNVYVMSGTEAATSAASDVTRFYTYVHGRDAFGVYDLAKDQPKLYILANAVDTNSPVGRVSVVSWAGSYACKILNSDWVVAARFTEA